MRHVGSRLPSGQLGEDRGVIALLPVDKQQHPGADTNECSVCVRDNRDVDAVPLHKKDLRRVDNEDVLVVRVDVWRFIKGHVREHGDVRICLCECLSDKHHPAVVVDDVLLVPLERKHQTPHLHSFSLMMSETNAKPFKSSGAWTAPG